jgi:poly-beta-1,6-N-acetyl-D-glucosamine synthase
MNGWLWLFWGAAIVLAYTFAGYPIWLWLRSRVSSRPVRRRPQQPFISIVMVARNEERVLDRKIENLLAIEYPASRYEIIVISDGSSDGTAAILQKWAASSRIRISIKPAPQGKAAGLNDAIAMARGEIVVFTDARQLSEPAAFGYLVENFADESVGCVTGDLLLSDPRSGKKGGLGLYWRLEKKLWELEAACDSAVGSTGAFYAARRVLLPHLPIDTVLDDVYIPMEIVHKGKRVILDRRARSWDQGIFAARQEWTRKVRTLAGNYQLLMLQPWLLTRANPVRFEFVSHKLLKLWTPFAMIGLLCSSIVLSGMFYRVASGLQIAFYGIAVAGFWRNSRGFLSRIAHSASMFVLLNAAAAASLVVFLRGHRIDWKQETPNRPAYRGKDAA